MEDVVGDKGLDENKVLDVEQSRMGGGYKVDMVSMRLDLFYWFGFLIFKDSQINACENNKKWLTPGLHGSRNTLNRICFIFKNQSIN